MAVKIQIRRDTTSNWTANNPILSVGEIGWDTTLKKGKVGDGSTTWGSLAFSIFTQAELDAKANLASPTFTGTVTAATVSLTTADTATAASHYFVETASDGVVRPKTLANAQTELVSNTAMQANVVSPTAAGSNGIRKVTMSTSAPTGGNDGDMWLVYV